MRRTKSGTALTTPRRWRTMVVDTGDGNREGDHAPVRWVEGLMVEIGSWVRRDVDPDEENTKWHVVESVVAGAAITRCGRRLEPEVDGHTLEVSEVEPLTRMIGQPQLCKSGCDRPAPIA